MSRSALVDPICGVEVASDRLGASRLGFRLVAWREPLARDGQNALHRGAPLQRRTGAPSPERRAQDRNQRGAGVGRRGRQLGTVAPAGRRTRPMPTPHARDRGEAHRVRGTSSSSSGPRESPSGGAMFSPSLCFSSSPLLILAIWHLSASYVVAIAKGKRSLHEGNLSVRDVRVKVVQNFEDGHPPDEGHSRLEGQERIWIADRYRARRTCDHRRA
jgi:hypothetical protein